MKWRKMGRIFCPTGQNEWMESHASLPIAEHIEKDRFRIYFSSRDSQNRSYTGWVDIDLSVAGKIVELSTSPVLSPGEPGAFDDSGAMSSWLVNRDRNRYLYYIGWNQGITVPFRNAIGLAISRDGGQFERYSSGPIMDRTPVDPYFCASCSVITDGDSWRIWYLSGAGWSLMSGKPRPSYHIKYAESDDGIHWSTDGTVAIDFVHSGEYAISRPAVVHDSDRWRMWYSWRGSSYRIGYAESVDGRHWTRCDTLAGIDVSLTGWDSEMIEYPFVFDHKDDRYMLYNGNGYGSTGFGLAVLEG